MSRRVAAAKGATHLFGAQERGELHEHRRAWIDTTECVNFDMAVDVDTQMMRAEKGLRRRVHVQEGARRGSGNP